ncbi:hypothetical protein PQR15_01075 [Streptomyces lydicus]|nr:hypothetical protein [Streptomyces lydicus]
MIRRDPFLRLAFVWLTAVNALLVALYYTTVFALQGGGRGAAALGLVLALAGAAGLGGALLAPSWPAGTPRDGYWCRCRGCWCRPPPPWRRPARAGSSGCSSAFCAC